MSDYIVSARKYRPESFESVIGQEATTKTLKNAIKNNQLAHAYLFCGPRGVGKTTCARIFAKTINCLDLGENTEACNSCENCNAFRETRSFNIHELDAASNNSVDDIRNLVDQVRIPPQVGRYSIYIIDEVHMLSASAFNAFLKTLEEPPKHAVFILATTQKERIIPTILSRCQIFDFNRIGVPDIMNHLSMVAAKEGIEAEPEALNIIAQKADGALRDALSIFDQIVSFSNRKLSYSQVIESLNVLDYEYFFRMTDYFVQGNIPDVLLLFNEIMEKGFDPHSFLIGLSSHFRDLLVSKKPETVVLLQVAASIRERYLAQAAGCSAGFLLSSLEVINHFDVSYRNSRNQRLHIELALIRLCSLAPGEPDQKKKNDVKYERAETRDDVVQEVKPPAQVAAPEEQEDKTAPLSDNPPGNTGYRVKKDTTALKKTSTPSIKNILKGLPAGQEPAAPEDQAPENTESPSDQTPIDPEVLGNLWKSFADNIEKDRPRMATTLRNTVPKLVDETIVRVNFDNSDQLKDFNRDIKVNLQMYLRDQIRNPNLVIESDVSTIIKNKIIYTQQEKFEHLKSKNPAIEEMRNMLNLDFD